MATASIPDRLSMEDTLASHPFTERHHRIIDQPIDAVWRACRTVTTREVRLLAPLMALRSLPRVLRRDAAITMQPELAMLDAFAAEGFVVLRHDHQPTGGHALILFGAAGKFWSPSHNAPRQFDSTDEFLGFDEPGFAKTVARLEAIALGPDRTLIETETWVTGTDPASTRRFAPYWAIIRGPSGLIRRSWLRAIHRRTERLA